MGPSILSLNRKTFQILGVVTVSVLLVMMKRGDAFEFKVGGATSSWTVPHAADVYNHWAENTRFQIGDTLLFVYDGNEDSVLHVTKEDYTNCNTESPIEKFSDGHTSFALSKSGPHYFISGDAERCRKNEKLVVVVMADRSKPKSGDASSSPPPADEDYSPPPPPSDDSSHDRPYNAAVSTTAGALAALLGFSAVLAI